MLKNCMEDIVEDLLPVVLDNYGNICKCEKCIQDISAIALNNLKPLYAVTENGKVYSKLNQLKVQFKIDVINQVTQAIEIVSKNPLHNI